MSATGFILFAAALIRRASPASGSRVEDLKWRFLPTGLYLVVALLLAAAIIALASRWRRAPRSAMLSASDQLTEFRLLYEKGRMSRDEFERVRARLGGEIRGSEPAANPRPAPTPQTPTATAPGAATSQQSTPVAPPPATPESAAASTPVGPAPPTPESSAASTAPPAPATSEDTNTREEPPAATHPS